MKLSLILLTAIIIHSSLFAEKGEIILGDTEYISGPNKKYKINTFREKKKRPNLSSSRKKINKRKIFINKKKKIVKNINTKPYISLIIGKNRLNIEQVGRNVKLPIVITVTNFFIQKSKLVLLAKNISTGRTFIIYKLSPFLIKRNWAQDQFLWNSMYIDQKKERYLPTGQYQIICTLVTTKKTYISYWGKANKNYYVNVIN